MKICIVTVYNTINSGSYWQAKALGMTLEKLGNETVYLKRKNDKNSSSSNLNKTIKLIKILIKCKFKETIITLKTFREFHKSEKNFSIIPNNEKYFKDIDCFILGSDTIWNIDSKFFLKNYKIFFGEIFKGKKVISYAASIGNTSIETIKKYKDIPEMLNNLHSILVRDQETSNMVKKLTNRQAEIVCDPTLLLTKKDYEKIENIPMENKYIFLYLQKKLTNQQIKELKEFSSKNNLKIVSCGQYDRCADENIVNYPEAFLNYMLYADYIITDTFHGTVFSVNLEKNFIVLNQNKKKVNDFLYRVGLENRLINNDEKITSKFIEKIDYKKSNEKLNEFRKNSYDFLKQALDTKKNSRKVNQQ